MSADYEKVESGRGDVELTVHDDPEVSAELGSAAAPVSAGKAPEAPKQPFVKPLSNLYMRKTAQLTKHEIRGKWSFCFLTWGFVATGLAFSLLLWHFITSQCTQSVTTVDPSLANAINDPNVFKNAYSSSYNYICASYFQNSTNGQAIECHLSGLSCKEYGKYQSQCPGDRVMCNPHLNCGDMRNTKGYAAVTYLQCTTLPTALVNSMYVIMIVDLVLCF